MSFLHTFTPPSILLQIGPLTIYWYGLFVVTGIVIGTIVAMRLARRSGLSAETVTDSAFWAIIAGVVGARLYHVALHTDYYSQHLSEIPRIWEGGIAIHGGLIAGGLALLIYCHRHKINFWRLAAIYAPSLALAQAIGRWGNYFNQEVYGYPTDLPWGIPIEPLRRLPGFLNYEYFHPTFLYESLGNFVIFLALLGLFVYFIKEKKETTPSIRQAKIIVAVYLILYSCLRFFMEYFRIDPTPEIFHLRFPQLASIAIILFAIYLTTRD